MAQMVKQSHPWKAVGTGVLKALGMLLAVWLVWMTLRSTKGELGSHLREALPGFILLAVLLNIVVNLIGVWRWQLLLKVQGIPLSFWGLLRIFAIGIFFSNVIPGSVSGDLVRMGYIMAHAPGKKTEAALTIVADRFLGLSGLFVVGIGSSLGIVCVHPELLKENHVIATTIGLLFLGGFSMFVLVLIVSLRGWFLKRKFIHSLCFGIGRHLPGSLLTILGKLANSMDLYCRKPVASLEVLLLTTIVHVLLGMESFCLGRAFHENGMNLVQYLTSTAMSNVTALLPLTPGGMGIRDAVTAILLKCFQAHPEEVIGLIPVAYTLVGLLWALLGASLMLFHPREQALESGKV